ncbi:TetR family transcriptional regulator [Blastococcus sp. SYSU D00669]
MCEEFSGTAADPTLPEANRRAFLRSGRRGGRTRLVLLGAAGGPAALHANRFGISTAVVHGDRVCVVDLGPGSAWTKPEPAVVDPDRPTRGPYRTPVPVGLHDTPCSLRKLAESASLRHHEGVSTGLRERKKLATRLALHEAALRLVAERGLEHVSVDDIVERADVSPRTFFNYFSGKDEAVLGLDPEASTRQIQAFRDRPAEESPLQALRAVQRVQVAEMATETELWPLRLKVIDAHPALVGRLAAAFGESERALAEAIAERTGSTVGVDVLPTLLAGVAAAVMRTSLHRWFTTDFTASLPDLVDEAWDAVAAGLPTPS